MSGPQNIPKAGELRRSQVVTTFGPGAMLDLPDISVLVGGLEYWHGADRQAPIVEKRLKAKVEELLGVSNVRFFAPPVEQDLPNAPKADIGVIQFPRWFVAQSDRTVERNGRIYRTRPLVQANRLEKGKWTDENRKGVEVVPVRFVQACPRGHISDIDWFVFAGAERSETLWLDEGGAGNDFAEIYVRRERNGAVRQLADAAILKNRVLGKCHGNLLWMGSHEHEDCNQPNRLLTRSASNAYFPQIQGVISIPDAAEAVRDAVEGVYADFLQYAESQADVERERKRAKVHAALEGHATEAVWREVERRKSGRAEIQRPIKVVEVETLRSQPKDKGEPVGAVDFHARSRDISKLPAPLAGMVDRIVLVHRLREVVAQVGFTRFEAYTTDVNGELSIDVERAPLARDVSWVPAIENRGEGVFIGFAKKAIDEWSSRPAVMARGRVLLTAYDAAAKQRAAAAAPFPALLPYYCLHSLSHMLITAVSLACGYSSSSIRERVYVGDAGYGILLYTGVSGSEGTLGGLVEVGRHIEDYLLRALESGRLCSNDPVCAQHDPDSTYEDRFLHGAACHGCLLIAETSCERFNQYLDRALVVPTVDHADCALFKDVGTTA